jgi:hypothetical protein
MNTFFRRWLLWERTFSFSHPHFSLEDVAQRINDLDRPKDTFFTSHTRTASAIRVLFDTHRYSIAMAHMHKSRYDWYASAELNGDLTRDPATDATVASGTIRIAQGLWRQMLIWLIAVVFLSLVNLFASNFLNWLGVLFATGMIIFHLGTAISDRQDLLHTLHSIMNTRVQSSNPLKPKHTLTDEAVDAQVEMTFSEPRPSDDSAMTRHQPK